MPIKVNNNTSKHIKYNNNYVAKAVKEDGTIIFEEYVGKAVDDTQSISGLHGVDVTAVSPDSGVGTREIIKDNYSIINSELYNEDTLTIKAYPESYWSVTVANPTITLASKAASVSSRENDFYICQEAGITTSRNTQQVTARKYDSVDDIYATYTKTDGTKFSGSLTFGPHTIKVDYSDTKFVAWPGDLITWTATPATDCRFAGTSYKLTKSVRPAYSTLPLIAPTALSKGWQTTSYNYSYKWTSWNADATYFPSITWTTDIISTQKNIPYIAIHKIRLSGTFEIDSSYNFTFSNVEITETGGTQLIYTKTFNGLTYNVYCISQDTTSTPKADNLNKGLQFYIKTSTTDASQPPTVSLSLTKIEYYAYPSTVKLAAPSLSMDQEDTALVIKTSNNELYSTNLYICSYGTGSIVWDSTSEYFNCNAFEFLAGNNINPLRIMAASGEFDLNALQAYGGDSSAVVSSIAVSLQFAHKDFMYPSNSTEYEY